MDRSKRDYLVCLIARIDQEVQALQSRRPKPLDEWDVRLLCAERNELEEIIRRSYRGAWLQAQQHNLMRLAMSVRLFIQCGVRNVLG